MKWGNRGTDRCVKAGMRWRLWLSAIAVVSVAGCGDGGAAPAGTQPSTGVGGASVQPTVNGSGGLPLAASGTPVPIAVGKVEVRLSKASYRVGEVVQVTVANGSDKSIYMEDFKTVCSIVTLQRSEGGGWKPIEGCQLGRPTATVAIGAGLGLAVDINPNSMHFRNGANEIGFGPGTYRVKFGYRLDRDRMGEEPLVAYSPEFEVR
jgi:hypothetical protein